MKPPPSRIYRFGSFRLDADERVLRRNGEIITVPPRAFDVLMVLVERTGSLVTKQELLREVWAGTAVEEANLAVAVSTLRRALGRELIETVPKYGYRLTERVQSVSAAEPATRSFRAGLRRLRVPLALLALGLASLIVVAGVLPRYRRVHVNSHSSYGLVSIQRLTNTVANDSQVSAGPDGRLVFSTERDGNPEIYSADPDGGNPVRLTNSPAVDDFPEWSPDGRWIAFASDREGIGSQIHIMAADGSTVRAVTALPLNCSEPSWSPDGRRIAFRRDNKEGEGQQDIYTISVDGTDLRRLTLEESNEVAPAWSPDGQTIAFASNRGVGGEFHLYLIDANGGSPRQVTFSPGGDLHPAWSPEGTELAFVSGRAGGIQQLYILQLAGGGVRRITKDMAEFPTWSRDGASILFAGNAPGNLELFRAELDSAQAITGDHAHDELGAWSPDGRNIVFTSNRDGKRALYQMDYTGGATTRLTDGTANDSFPSWAPDGRRIVFQSDRRNEGGLDLCVLELASRSTRSITGGGHINASPAWSPDGARIAFESNRDGGPNDFRIYTVEPDGSGLSRLTSGGPGGRYDRDPAWAPDASALAFSSNRVDPARFEVYTMKSDGSGARVLTPMPDGATNPSWSPNGRWIAYTGSRSSATSPRTRFDVFVIPSRGGAPIRLTYRSASWPRWDPRGHRMVFESYRHRNWDLFLAPLPEEIDGDGRGEVGGASR